MSDELQTEEQILETARQVFHNRGFDGTRMQEIADEAGFNKSMLYYYFRSKDKLFQVVFRESIRQFFSTVFEVLNSNLALNPKINKLVETYDQMFKEQPHLPRFIIHEMNQHPDRFKQFVSSMGIGIPERFVKQIRAEIEAGTMQKIEPQEFIINAMGMCVFPLIARPMFEIVFDMNDEQYQQFLEHRKKELPKFILNTVKK